MRSSQAPASRGPFRRLPLRALGVLLLGGAAVAGGQSLSISDAVVTEGDTGTTTAVFVVALSGVTPLRVTVDYSTLDGTATAAGGDYQPTSGTLTFLSAQPQEILVPVHGDVLVEGDETFSVRLQNPVNATLANAVATGTILDDDTTGLTIDDVSVLEGDAGTTDAVFTVSLSAPSSLPVAVGYATRDGSASVADGDYRGAQGTLSFEPGELRRTLAVAVNGDTRVEPDETFFVELTSAENASVDDGQGEAIIRNDDEEIPPRLAIDDVSVFEGDAGTVAATFTVTLSEPSGTEVTVDYATRDGSATADDGDYQPATGTLSFPAGQTARTLAVVVQGDTRVEPDENFFLDLASATGATIADGQGEATIRNDDEEPSRIRLLSVPPVIESAGTATLRAERFGGTESAARVTLTATSGTAAAGEDFVAVSRVLEWVAGESGEKTLELEITDDNLEEQDETVTLTLERAVNSLLDAPRQLALVILDDDAPMEIQPVGESEIDARVGQEIELRVQVLRDEGSPVAGATVLWSVEGEAELLDGPRTQSDSEGFASQRLRLRARAGDVIVTATVEGSSAEGVVFQLAVEGNLGERFDPREDPGEAAVARVLDQSCSGAGGEFGEMCEYLFSLEAGDQRAAVAELPPRETAAQATISLSSQRIQTRNIGARLAALRGGATRQTVDQLAFVVRGGSFQVASLSPVWRPEDRLAEQLDQALRDVQADGDASEVEEAVDGDGRLGFFFSGQLSIGDRPSTRREEGFDLETRGLTAGVDYRWTDRFVIGGALGYLDTDADLAGDGGSLDARGFSLSTYASYYLEKLYLDAFLSWGRNEYDLARNIDLPRPFQGRRRFVAQGSPGGRQLTLGLGGGYEAALGAYTLGAFGQVSYTEASIDGYAERGAGPFDLVVGEQDAESALAEAGLDLTYAASFSWGVLQPALRLSLLHELEDDVRFIGARFAQDRTANEFRIPTDAPDRDFFNLTAGLTATLVHGRTLYLVYDTELERDDLSVYTLTAGIRLEL